MVRKGAFEVNSVCAIWLPVLSEILSLASKTLWYLVLLPRWCPSVATPPPDLWCSHYSATKLRIFPCLCLWVLMLPSACNAPSLATSCCSISAQLTAQHCRATFLQQPVDGCPHRLFVHFPSPPHLCCLSPVFSHACMVSLMALPHCNMGRLRSLS